MIATRKMFGPFPTVQNRTAERLFHDRLTLTYKRKQSRNCWLERDGLLWREYLAEPRARSLVDDMAESHKELKRLRQQHSVSELVAEFTRELFKRPVTIHQESDPDFQCDYF